MIPSKPNIFCRIVQISAWSYLVLLYAWLVAYFASGDRFGYLGLVNLVAVYLFFPLPFTLVLGLVCRLRGLWTGSAVGLAAFLVLWGELFLPWRLVPAQSSAPTLSVMTYNVLAHHQFTEPLIDTIRAEDVDLVLLQELTPNLAQALGKELESTYPYQILEPVDNPRGIGVISKYPIYPTGVELPLEWVGGPQVLTLEWYQHQVTVVNFHMYPTTRIASQARVAKNFRLREAEARALVDLARQSSPLIMGGDANSVPISDSYQILTGELHDAWRERGFGLGHTFPGSTIPGSDRPHIGPWYVPPWLARIDYVFHSSEWETVSARLAKFDGVSDHRGVVAELRLKQ